ncbi:MAG: hypothetical protein H0X43_03655 [Nitrosospira sp.]|nr:hypothetical protein [Nitrosospira sp.]
MSSRPSTKPGNGRSKRSTADQKSVAGELTAADGNEPGRHERRKGHQIISTATYYRTDRRGSGNFGYDELQEWMDADLDPEGGL